MPYQYRRVIPTCDKKCAFTAYCRISIIHLARTALPLHSTIGRRRGMISVVALLMTHSLSQSLTDSVNESSALSHSLTRRPYELLTDCVEIKRLIFCQQSNADDQPSTINMAQLYREPPHSSKIGKKGKGPYISYSAASQ